MDAETMSHEITRIQADCARCKALEARAEAAEAELAEAKAEIADLRKLPTVTEREELEEKIEWLKGRAKDEQDVAEAKLARCREALVAVEDFGGWMADVTSAETFDQIRRQVRAALEATKAERGDGGEK